MSKIPILAGFLLVLLCAPIMAETSLDSNVAFFEGETMNYIIYPPNDFQMVEWDATVDGYSFAFIPRGQTYEAADVVIGINLFKIRGLSFDKVVSSDTTSIREYFGKDIEIWPVDSVYASTGQEIVTFHIDRANSYIPNVMLSYVDGATELLVFELVVSENATRLIAEDRFVECLGKLKILVLGDLGYND